MTDDKLPMDDERYRIPGTNMFNMSKWSRENDPKPPARYKVGDHVVLVTDAEVLRVFEDCDGTPLYELDHGGSGWGDDNVLPGHEDDWQLDGAADKARAALARTGDTPDAWNGVSDKLARALTDADAARARIAALEAALRDVCEAAMDDYAGCSICDSVPGYEPGNFIHAPDCPVAAALALLEPGP